MRNERIRDIKISSTSISGWAGNTGRSISLWIFHFDQPFSFRGYEEVKWRRKRKKRKRKRRRNFKIQNIYQDNNNVERYLLNITSKSQMQAGSVWLSGLGLVSVTRCLETLAEAPCFEDQRGRAKWSLIPKPGYSAAYAEQVKRMWSGFASIGRPPTPTLRKRRWETWEVEEPPVRVSLLGGMGVLLKMGASSFL